MNLYLSNGQHWSGTQKDAKALGEFVPVEVPVDKPGLIQWLNEQWAEPELGTLPLDAEVLEREYGPVDEEATRPHQNGDPTTVFMGSRHPEAKTICLVCGRTPHQQKYFVNSEASMSIQGLLHDVTDARSLDSIAKLIEERRASL